VIENYPESQVEEMEAVNNPEDTSMGTRRVPFSRDLYIEQDDFQEIPQKKFFRLAPGQEVRLRYAYIIKCTDVIKNDDGEVVELRCTYDPDTRSGTGVSDRKVKGTIHWVSAGHAIEAEVRLYNHLFTGPDPSEVDEGEDWKSKVDLQSLQVLTGQVEPSLKETRPGEPYQFERLGYFCMDSVDSSKDKPVFNRTETLRDTWAKIAKQSK
jgi:glutaminyl-tRNA synthetase